MLRCHALPRLALLSLLLPCFTATPVRACGPAGSTGGPTSATTAFEPGQPAPDFAYACRFGWRRFHDLLREGDALVVFEPDLGTLAALQRALPELGDRGVTPFVVRRASDGANWEAIERLDLGYALFSDPEGLVADLFGLREASEDGPAWCVVGRDGHIRSAGIGDAGEGIAAVLSVPTASVPAVASGDESR